AERATDLLAAHVSGIGRLWLVLTGSVQTSAEPSSTTVPPWLTIVVRSLVSGLSSRASSTSTSAVISSPGLTGALKSQSTWRKTVPGPVYERAAERGRMIPAGLEYVDSWVEQPELGRCWQLMRTEDPGLFDEWI